MLFRYGEELVTVNQVLHIQSFWEYLSPFCHVVQEIPFWKTFFPFFEATCCFLDWFPCLLGLCVGHLGFFEALPALRRISPSFVIALFFSLFPAKTSKSSKKTKKRDTFSQLRFQNPYLSNQHMWRMNYNDLENSHHYFFPNNFESRLWLPKLLLLEWNSSCGDGFGR